MVLKENESESLRKDLSSYLSKEKQTVVAAALEVLKTSGAEVIENIEIPSAKAAWKYDVLTYEFKPDLNAYLSQSAPVHTCKNFSRPD